MGYRLLNNIFSPFNNIFFRKHFSLDILLWSDLFYSKGCLEGRKSPQQWVMVGVKPFIPLSTYLPLLNSVL